MVKFDIYTCENIIFEIKHYKGIIRYQTTLLIHMDVVCVRQSPAISGFQISSRYGVVIVEQLSVLSKSLIKNHEEKKDKV